METQRTSKRLPARNKKRTHARRIVDGLGGYKAVAELLEVSPSTVCCWFDRGIPPKQAMRLMTLTKGRFNACDLIPDICQ